jgi:hypothetical protein
MNTKEVLEQFQKRSMRDILKEHGLKDTTIDNIAATLDYETLIDILGDEYTMPLIRDILIEKTSEDETLIKEIDMANENEYIKKKSEYQKLWTEMTKEFIKRSIGFELRETFKLKGLNKTKRSIHIPRYIDNDVYTAGKSGIITGVDIKVTIMVTTTRKERATKTKKGTFVTVDM